MAQNDSDLENIQTVLRFLGELHKWELDNIPILRTMTGRDVYLTLAGGLDEGSAGISLKSFKNNNHYTDKAITNRLEILQNMQVIKKLSDGVDGRVKIIKPDHQFHDYCVKHALTFFQKISKYYTLIEK